MLLPDFQERAQISSVQRDIPHFFLFDFLLDAVRGVCSLTSTGVPSGFTPPCPSPPGPWSTSSSSSGGFLASRASSARSVRINHVGIAAKASISTVIGIQKRKSEGPEGHHAAGIEAISSPMRCKL